MLGFINHKLRVHFYDSGGFRISSGVSDFGRQLTVRGAECESGCKLMVISGTPR